MRAAALWLLLAAPAPGRERGIALLEKGDVPAALVELRAAVAATPSDAVAHDYLGVALGESGQTDAAAAAFREAIRLDPRRVEAHFHLGVVLDRLGRAQEAVRAYQTALRLKPDSVEARYGLSVVSAKLGDLDGTIRLLREVTDRAPGLSDAHYDVGVYLWTRYRGSRGPRRPADLDEAEAALRKAVALDGTRAKYRLALGQLLAERQRLDEAVGELRQAAALARDPAYAYDLGLALRMQGDLDGAEAQLRAAIAGDPRHGEARRALGLILRQKGDLEAAARELRLSVAERPADAQGHNVLGGVLLKLGDLDGAIEEFRQAARLDPALTEAQVNLAQAFAKAGRQDDARAALAEVQRLKERETALSRAMVLVEMAATQLDKGDAAAAVASLREAVAASPDFAEAHYQLGRALRSAAGPPAAIEDALLRAVQLDPGHALARFEWAQQLAARGDTLGAVDQLRKAVELRPSLVDAHRELARRARASGDWATAVAELQAVLAWEPQDARAREELAAATWKLDPKRTAPRNR
jgi:tetratricopeptide (TPR) repeat protein